MPADVFAPNPIPPPAWAKDAVIYELNPRTFTSPSGPGAGDGSGTFASTATKFPYLRQLGVNTIWLAGYCQATDHFYGVWSVYATLDPTRLDPCLGTKDDFKAMVRLAHDHGIRVLLDVISHGVLDESPLVAEHPKWFSGRSWGMTDYDYTNPQFREWWVDLWASYVAEYGVDGFRVDIDLRDAQLWDAIALKCAESGHEVLVMPEHGRYHLGQQDTSAFSADIAADWQADDLRLATVQVSCHDSGWLSKPGNYYRVRGRRGLFGYSALLAHRVPVFFAGEEFDATQNSVPKLRRGLYGAGGPGGWLYGSALDWQDLADPDKAAMYSDVSTMLRARATNADIVNADHHVGNIVPLTSAPPLALVPYARYRRGEGAVIVAANEADVAVDVKLDLPLAEFGLGGGPCELVDVLSGERSRLRNGQGRSLELNIGPEGKPGGGIAVLRVNRL